MNEKSSFYECVCPRTAYGKFCENQICKQLNSSFILKLFVFFSSKMIIV
jgi:hypothetical protein